METLETLASLRVTTALHGAVDVSVTVALLAGATDFLGVAPVVDLAMIASRSRVAVSANSLRLIAQLQAYRQLQMMSCEWAR